MTASESGPRLLYFSTAATGGLADYAREQANALARCGIEVDLLTTASFPARADDGFRLWPELTEKASGGSRWSGRLASIDHILGNHGRLARFVEGRAYRHVLMGAYAEYLAPLWCGPLLRLARRGVVWGAVVHDPMRDFQVGPRWWHRRSIASAYSFLREAFVHEPVTLDTVRPTPQLRTSVIPHGPYVFPPATKSRDEARREWGIPDAAQVWLSFGHVRNGKNLDLAIRALARFPEAFLVVAGKEQSGGQKPVAFYRELARQSGVADRCVWLNRFIAPEEVGNLFVASDLVLLTYSGQFRSASGVLNAAVAFRKPCVASGGQGNLRTMVARYDLGIWIEPDQLEAFVAGVQRWQSAPPVPRWEAYEAENSWERNAEIVRERMFAPHEAFLS